MPAERYPASPLGGLEEARKDLRSTWLDLVGPGAELWPGGRRGGCLIRFGCRLYRFCAFNMAEPARQDRVFSLHLISSQI